MAKTSTASKVIDLATKRLAAKVKTLLIAETAIAKQERIAGPLRIEVGRELAERRKAWPERGPNAKGWGEFLATIGMPRQRAWELIQLVTVPAEVLSDPDKSRAANMNDAIDHKRPVEFGMRDGWCTPDWLCELLPEVDLDPCSNPRSHVRAKKTYSLEAGRDGLELAWKGIVYVNGPYSDLEPWAEKLDHDRPAVAGAGFLVNADHSPAWWKLLTKHLHLRLDFNERLEFSPPEGVEPSKNDRPQTLLMDDVFWQLCKTHALLERASLWRKAS